METPEEFSAVEDEGQCFLTCNLYLERVVVAAVFGDPLIRGCLVMAYIELNKSCEEFLSFPFHLRNTSTSNAPCWMPFPDFFPNI